MVATLFVRCFPLESLASRPVCGPRESRSTCQRGHVKRATSSIRMEAGATSSLSDIHDPRKPVVSLVFPKVWNRRVREGVGADEGVTGAGAVTSPALDAAVVGDLYVLLKPDGGDGLHGAGLGALNAIEAVFRIDLAAAQTNLREEA